MKLKAAGLLACLFASSIAGAQNVVPIQQLQVAPRPVAQVAQIDEEAMEKTRLERENSRLREENAALKLRVDNLTNVGGSEVRAYCPTSGTSRNTAGAEANCQDNGGYLCEPVSGLCRTRCQTSDMCAGGWTCDTGVQQCVRTG